MVLIATIKEPLTCVLEKPLTMTHIRSPASERNMFLSGDHLLAYYQAHCGYNSINNHCCFVSKGPISGLSITLDEK